MAQAAPSRRTWLTLCFVLASACSPVGPVGCEDDPAEGYTCNLEDTGQVLSGTWKLSATGHRSGCADRRLEGDFDLEVDVPLHVDAEAQATLGPSTGAEIDNEADAFVERIRRADYVLTAEDMPEELEPIHGSTNGSCVSFALTENLPRGDSLRYRFEGYIISSSRVVGDLTGDGPEDCRVTGTFELNIR